MATFKFELGSRVRDKVTGFTGIVICRTEWLHGCIGYSVKSQQLHEGKPVEAIGYDESGIELVATPKEVAKAVKTGGPVGSPARGH